MHESPVDSRQFFRIHRSLWLLLGYTRQPAVAVLHYQWLYYFYAIVMNFIIIIFYPGATLIAVFNSGTRYELVQALPVAAAALSCCGKSISYHRQIHVVQQIEQLFSTLDERVMEREGDCKYFVELKSHMNFIMNTFRFICGIFLIATLLSVIMAIDEQRLPFAVPLSFDWHASMLNYVAMVLMQILFLIWNILQTFVNDSFPAIVLCLLSNHAHLLGERLARIGYNKMDDESVNVMELRRCILDHQCLYRLHSKIQKVVSFPVFIQYAVTAFQDCFSLIILVFYSSNGYDRLVYFTYLLTVQLQIFPTLYYGTICSWSMDELLLRRVYDSNWTQQNHVYRRLISIFLQRNLKDSTAYAVGLIPINLGAFLKTLQGAYTFYTFVNKFRKH